MVEAQLLAAWLTPTSLFVVLNIVLVTIFLSKNNNNHHNAAVSSTAAQPQVHPQQLIRAPSLFSRVASFNFSHYYHSDDSHVAPPPDSAAAVVIPPVVNTVARAPSLLFRVASFKFRWTPPPQAEDGKGKEVNVEEKARDGVSEGHVRRENEEEAVKKVKKVVRKKKVKKEEVVADVEKVKEKTTAFRREDEEVDTKADDFINRFKQQLKMQRLESLLRYRSNATPV